MITIGKYVIVIGKYVWLSDRGINQRYIFRAPASGSPGLHDKCFNVAPIVDVDYEAQYLNPGIVFDFLRGLKNACRRSC